MNRNPKTGYIVRLGVLMAIVAVFTLLNIGNIPIGPIVATIYQVPVIIGALLLGTKAGAILGAFWGILCFWLALSGQTTDIVALTMIQQSPFKYLLIAVVPRVLTGVFAGLVYSLMRRFAKKEISVPALAASGAIGSATNTFFYLGGLYFIAKALLAELYGITLDAVLGMVLGVAATNGIVEAIVSAVLVSAVCSVMLKVDKRIK